MAFKGRRVTVTTTATRLTTAATDSVTGQAAVVKNDSAVNIDVGGDDVTAGAGFLVEPGATVPAEMTSNADILYGIVASGTASMSVLENGIS